jgi:hypothetical protein
LPLYAAEVMNTVFGVAVTHAPPEQPDEQVAGVPHCPFEPQVCTCVPEAHWVVPGLHALQLEPMHW